MGCDFIRFALRTPSKSFGEYVSSLSYKVNAWCLRCLELSIGSWQDESNFQKLILLCESSAKIAIYAFMERSESIQALKWLKWAECRTQICPKIMKVFREFRYVRFFWTASPMCSIIHIALHKNIILIGNSPNDTMRLQKTPGLGKWTYEKKMNQANRIWENLNTIANNRAIWFDHQSWFGHAQPNPYDNRRRFLASKKFRTS